MSATLFKTLPKHRASHPTPTACARPAPVQIRLERALATVLVCLLTIIGVLGGRIAGAQEISVSATVEPASLSLGESAELSVSIQGAQEPDQPPAIQVEDAQIQYVGPTKQASLINFQLSVSMSHRYVFTPSRAGEFTIPPIPLEIRGKRYETKPVSLKVTASPEKDSPPSTPSPFVECEIPRRPVYVGEAFPVQVRLVVPSETPWRIERLPQFETDAFTKSPFQQPQQQQQVRDGRPYDTLFFPTALTAIKSGEVPLGPIHFKIQVAAPQKKQPNARNPLSGILNGFPFVTQQNTFQEKTVTLPQHKMQVRDLPEQDKPSSFRGAIGQFNFNASFHQNRVKAGEPVVVTLTIQGQGNFDRIEAPPLSSPEGWRVYPPEIQFTKGDEFGLKGVKTFKIAIVPQNAQSQMPEFEFASFNAEAGTYQIQKSLPAPLQVEGSLDKPQTDSTQRILPKKITPPAEPAPSQQDNTVPGVLEENLPSPKASRFWNNRIIFWSVQACLVAAILTVGIKRWNAGRLAALGPAPRLRQEAQKIHADLPALRSKTDWFQQARRAVQLYTASRSGQPPEAVDLPEALAALNPTARLETDLRWLFETDATLRFSGSKVDSAPKIEEQDRIRSLLQGLLGDASS